MTKTTKLTSFQTIKKFLAPIKNSPKEYSWLIFMAIYSSVIMVFFANLIKWISDFISKKDVESIYRYGVYYAILVIVFQVLQWIFRSNDRIVSYKTNIFLRAEYFKKMIKMDNNLYETNGTGKLIGIGSN
jgi:ABC-type multidrug transport system fused ATPase/permease subunit